MKKMISFLGKECPFSQAMSVDYYEFLNENADFLIETYYIEDDNELARSLKVFSVPVFLMANDDKEYCRFMGQSTKQNLVDFYSHECVE